MARCGCSQECNCVVTGGAGTAVTGTGTSTDPYVVTATSSPGAVLYRDTNTIDLTLSGAGTGPSPYEVSGAVRLDPSGGLEAGINGLGVDLDPAPGNTLFIGPEGLRSEGAAAVSLDPAGGLQLTANGLAVKADPASPAPVTTGVGGVRVSADQAAILTRLDFLQHVQRGQFTLGGGGDRQANQTHVKWASAFYFLPPRRAADQTGGFYLITPPANGTVITGMGGAANATVPSSGNFVGMVPLADWQALWYLVPTTSSSSTTVAANFRITSYTAAASLPDNAVLVAWRDGAPGKAVGWGDGVRTIPWIKHSGVLKSDGSGVTVYPGTSGQQGHYYRVIDNHMEVMGYVLWAGTSMQAGLGGLYVDLPLTSPPLSVPKGNFSTSGHGRIYMENGGGGGGAMEWAIMPQLGAGSARMYFLVARAGNDARLGRLAVSMNTNPPPNNGSTPYIAERWWDTAGTDMQYQMSVPILNPVL